jgi:hypothetical protein
MAKGREGQQPMTLFLPAALHERLRAAAGGRGMSEIVRKALDSYLSPTLNTGRRDPDLQGLLEQITRAADGLAEVYEPNTVFFCDALAGALARLLAIHKQRARAGVEPTQTGDVIFGPDHDLERAIGWALAGAINE